MDSTSGGKDSRNGRLFSSLEMLHPRSLKHFSEKLQDLLRTKLWAKILAGAAAGIVVGIVLSLDLEIFPRNFAAVFTGWVAFPGQLFLALIQMVVMPLVFVSIIRGIAASESQAHLKKLGFSVSLYFIFTTAVSIVIGITLAMFFEPGAYINGTVILESYQGALPGLNITGSEINVPEAIIKLLPQNPVAAIAEGKMFQIVLFSIIVGIAVTSLAPEHARPLLNMCSSVQEVSLIVVKWAMRIAPWAVFGLLASVTAKVGIDSLFGIGAYIATVLVGLVAVGCMYCSLIFFVAKFSVKRFLSSIKEPQLLAFSTSSSAATMPLSIKCAEDQLGVRSSISQFLVPLGSTINMDGTALYQGVATVFLAQVFKIDLSIASLFLIVVTAVGASIGSPGAPGVGIVVLATVLQNVGIPTGGIALILGVDRLLDMCRTSVNVTGDLAACVVMDRLVGGSLDSTNRENVESSGQPVYLG